MFGKSRIISVMLALLALSAPCRAADAGTVRMGFFESVGMFNGAGSGQRKSGYCYDYMMQIANYTGWKYEFVYGSFADLYDMLKNGEIDILPYTNFNDQRSREVLFSNDPIAEEEYFLAVKPGTARLDEIKVISTMKDADYNQLLYDFIKANGMDVEITYHHYVNEIWDALRDGDANATIYTSNSYSNDGWNSIGSFGKKPTYICVAKGRPDLLSQLNEASDRISRESAALKDNLYARYFSDNPMRKSLTLEELEWIRRHPVLHVGCFSDDAPNIFTYDEETHTATGLTVDVISQMIERLNIEASADYRCYESIEDMEAALESDEIDVFFPFYPGYYVAQEHNLLISNTVRTANMELVYKKGTSINDALQKVAVRNTRLGYYYLQDNFPNSQIQGVRTLADALDMVKSGEATSAIARSIAMNIAMEKYDDLTSYVFAQGCGTCFATRSHDYPLIRILNRGLNYFTDNEISAIASNYTPTPNVTTRQFLKSHSNIAVLVCIILLALIALTIALIELFSLKRKADEANRSKTAFLFNMSHDIRTPMNAILGYTDVAIRHFDDAEKANDSLRKIKSSGQHLLSLINDILEMSRIESGSFELTEIPTDIRTAITNAEQMGQALAIPKSIDFKTVKGKIDNPYIYADVLHINEVIINLISNSVKYTNEGGWVRYYIDQIGEPASGMVTFRFEISDNGIGMSDEFQQHLFETFARERTATVSKQEGAGLGLSIVKRIVSMANGTINVKSKPGIGTTFTIEIPFTVMDEKEISKYRQNNGPVLEIKEDIDLGGKRVLLVEDNELNREIAGMILTESGLAVDSVDDGQMAVNAVRDKGVDYYDFILMDIQMPVMNGYEATAEIRKLPGASKMVIIALSANAFEEDKQTSRRAGMDGHVAKPIDVQELLGTMKKLSK